MTHLIIEIILAKIEDKKRGKVGGGEKSNGFSRGLSLIKTKIKKDERKSCTPYLRAKTLLSFHVRVDMLS